MAERIQAFEPDPRIDGQYSTADFYGETTMTEPGDEPGFLVENEDDGFSRLDSLGWYLRSLGDVPKYTVDDEIELAKQIEAGTHAEELAATCDPEKQRMLIPTIRAGKLARDKLVLSVLPLVVSIVKRDFGGNLPLSDIDMVQCGNLGAVRAVSAYDYTKGTSFGKTVAPKWIKKEIYAGLLEARRQKYLRGTTKEQIRADQVHKAKLKLESDPTAPVATVTALAKATGIKEAWVWDALNSSQRPSSVEALAEHAHDGIVDKKAPEIDERILRQAVPELSLDELAAEQAEKDVEILLGVLSPGERTVIRKMCGFEGDYGGLSEIAKDLGVKDGTLDVQRRRALTKLRSRSPGYLRKIADRLGVQILPPDEPELETEPAA